MKCESCNQREASTVCVQIVEDEKKILNLCGVCMAKFQEKSAPPADKKSTPPADSQLRCAQCGMSYEEFKKIGRLGCGACYAAFGVPLEKLLKRIHGAAQHRGKSLAEMQVLPRSEEELALLREQLEAAVAAEAYEEAAQLRDRIALLEGGPRRPAHR
ncbi:MAG: UvrB/UvrC motif-containing protein [Candidatus Latescibacteria bacterium]|nr:UvrB/UvrC motif-containing protein [Candidatus Latescibacterota bacterium]